MFIGESMRINWIDDIGLCDGFIDVQLRHGPENATQKVQDLALGAWSDLGGNVACEVRF